MKNLLSVLAVILAVAFSAPMFSSVAHADDATTPEAAMDKSIGDKPVSETTKTNGTKHHHKKKSADSKSSGKKHHKKKSADAAAPADASAAEPASK